MFMRGWTVIFGGWPTESELHAMFNSGEPVDLSGSFFIYFGVFLVTLVFTSFWQFGKDLEGHHPDVHEAMGAPKGESEVIVEDNYERVNEMT